MNPKYQKYIKRIESLISEGREVAKLQKGESRFIGHKNLQDKSTLLSWLTRVENILTTVFKETSPHYKRFKEYRDRGITKNYEVHVAIGILDGALDDLQNGFLKGQEFLIAGIVYDSILEEAKYLNKNEFKDPAAVLARVVIENTLKELAEELEIDIEQKASEINTELWKSERYSKPQWRLIQSWLDLGNSAAHGEFDDFSSQDVNNAIQGIEEFIAKELQ